MIKSTAIDPQMLDAAGVYRKTGPGPGLHPRTRRRGRDQGRTDRPVRPGDVIVLAGRGPLGSGMEETYQVTSALRYLDWGREVAVVTDARFSGVSTGACIGHVGPEALAGGPIGKVCDGDRIRIVVDTRQLTGSVDLVGDGRRARLGPMGRGCWPRGPRAPVSRPTRPCRPTPGSGRRCRRASGGTWGGCVYDVDAIIRLLAAGEAAERGNTGG